MTRSQASHSEKVSVITVTYNREELLLRGMKSIADQDYAGPIEHIIVGDGSDFLGKQEDRIRSFYQRLNRPLEVVVIHGVRDLDRYAWERVASHQNHAAREASGEYLVNLDDDNTFAPNHLSSLHAKISEGYEAAYSWRYMYNANGAPYLVDRYPWLIGNDVLRERLLFKIQCEAGTFQPGSNLVRDGLYLDYMGYPYCTVDASEWMYRRKLFTSGLLKFIDSYSYEDILFGHSSDYMLNKRIKELGLKVACTQLPTLNYYLSGNSQVPVVA